MKLTAHMIVYNEEKWVKLAILSVLPHVEEFLIFDTGSTDKTVEIIQSIKNPKIVFDEKGRVNASQMVELRNEQIRRTKTEWFMLADGDEVYPEKIFNQIKLNEKYAGIYLRNHVCVGDVYHNLPENYGNYELCGHKGHLNTRFYRLINGWHWWGRYPLEYYGPGVNSPINTMCSNLQFVNDYYWHMSFLERSSVKNRNHIKYHLGEKIKDELPEVFNEKIMQKRSGGYVVRSMIESPIRYIKNII